MGAMIVLHEGGGGGGGGGEREKSIKEDKRE